MNNLQSSVEETNFPVKEYPNPSRFTNDHHLPKDTLKGLEHCPREFHFRCLALQVKQKMLSFAYYGSPLVPKQDIYYNG